MSNDFREGSIITASTDSAGTRRRAATLALGATVGLTAFKLGVALLSGSVGVLSEGIHSFLDLVSATVSFFAVPQAVKPADEDHPFGHGKIETLSSLLESLLLLVAAGLIIYEAYDHLARPQPVSHQGLAIGTMGLSLGVSYGVYLHNRAASAETDSAALKVNALHFLSDAVASLAILAGLVILKLTGWLAVDSILGFGVAGYILFISLRQVNEALLELTDRQLPAREIQEIRALIEGFGRRMIEAHDLRTRKSGATRHIDFHLVVCGYLTVMESHALCDEIETGITGRFPTASVNIHVEPCGHRSLECQGSCPVYLAFREREKGENA